jgi:hypothetical protein
MNVSIKNGTFPFAQKKSVVKPIPKKGTMDEINNYHPSILVPIIFLAIHNLDSENLNQQKMQWPQS